MTKKQYGTIEGILLMPTELAYIEKTILDINSKKDIQITEWGSGGSTLRWLEITSKGSKIYSIEHNQKWYNNVLDNLDVLDIDVKNKLFYYFVEEELSHLYDHGYGDIQEENPFGLRKYINPDKSVYDADIFIIDGIGRGACLASVLLNRTNKNSVIFLHDYSLRVIAYDWITQFCDVELIGETLAKITFKEEIL